MSQIAGFRGALGNSSSKLVDPKDLKATTRDATRAVYRYHQTFAAGARTYVRKSFFAALGLEPWDAAQLRAHEDTDATARAAAIAGIAATGVHTDAVLVGFRDAAGECDRMFRKAESERPLIELATPDGTLHKLWRVQSAEVIGKLRPLFAPKRLYVLDGHARYEGMLAYRDTLAAAAPLAMYSSANYGLACLVNLDDSALAVGARHRIVRGDVTKDAVLAAARPAFIVEPIAGAATDAAKQLAALADTVAHQPAFVVTFAGDPDAFKLTLSPDASPAGLGATAHRAIQKYDPVVALQIFLPRAAPGASSQTAVDASAVIAAVAAGAAMGLVLRPLSIDQITHAADHGALLPFGSTAFHPQLVRTIAYVVDPDEDLV